MVEVMMTIYYVCVEERRGRREEEQVGKDQKPDYCIIHVIKKIPRNVELMSF